jgi:hypothetical protein
VLLPFSLTKYSTIFSEMKGSFGVNNWPQLRRAPNSRVFYWNGWRTDSKLRYVSFFFNQKPSLRNRFRRFRTKLRLKQRIEICIIFIFNKNLLWEIVSDAFGPNWDCRKELFPTFLVNLSFTYDSFWQKPSLRNRFRRFPTKLSL